jgi:hypothetical protein
LKNLIFKKAEPKALPFYYLLSLSSLLACSKAAIENPAKNPAKNIISPTNTFVI